MQIIREETGVVIEIDGQLVTGTLIHYADGTGAFIY